MPPPKGEVARADFRPWLRPVRKSAWKQPWSFVRAQLHVKLRTSFESLLLKADNNGTDYDSRVTDLSTGKCELFRLNKIIYWVFQQYAKVVTSVQRLYTYEIHTHAQTWKAHSQIVVHAAATLVDKNQELIKDQRAM